tara:strand:- start:488 stop:763 length:276 start_codon:yes stop_codon:yes gene_type:complete
MQGCASESASREAKIDDAMANWYFQHVLYEILFYGTQKWCDVIDVQRYRDTCDDLVRANTRAQKALQESERSKQELIKELAFMHGEKVSHS